MDSFGERKRAAETMFALEQKEEFVARMVRVDLLGDWAGRTMGTSPNSTAHYQEILRNIAVLTRDNESIIERVRDDLAAAGVYLTAQQVGDVFVKVKAD